MLRWLLWPLRWAWWALRWLPTRLTGPRRGTWLRVRLGPRVQLVAARRRGPLARWLRRGEPSGTLSLEALDDALRAARVDRRVAGVLLEVPPLACGWGRAWQLREVVARAAKEGLPTVAHLPLGGGPREMFVASAADRLWLEPEASLLVGPLGVERLYLGALLARFGVRFERYAAGRYKTAGEPLVSSEMSEAEREQLAALLEDWQAESDRALAPRFADAEAHRAARALLVAHGSEALRAGWVDRLVEGPGLPKALKSPSAEPARNEGGARDVEAGAAGGDEAAVLGVQRYRRWRRALRAPMILRPARFGVVRISGIIAERPEGGRVQRWLRALAAAAEDEKLAGLLLLVDSPGGGATASDRLRAAVAAVAARKPVVALMGDVAASGGYMAALGAHRIVAAPTTVTGSIGVVAVLPLLEALLERLGVRAESVATGPGAGFLSPWRSPTGEERQRFEAHLQAHYRSFVATVARSRGRSEEDVDGVAGGRVWSGRAALERGLVDELGGLHEALTALRKRAGLAPGRRHELVPLGAGRAPLDGLGLVGTSAPTAPGWLRWLVDLSAEPVACLAVEWLDVPVGRVEGVPLTGSREHL